MELKPNSKNFKILQLSNAWDIASGYGVESRGTLFEWNRHYDVRQLAMYGNEGRMRAYRNPEDPTDPNWLKVYPTMQGDQHGDKTAQLIFKRSKWKPDLFITLYDIWMGAYVEPAGTEEGFKPLHPYWVPIVMVDHDPVPELTVMSAKVAYRVVTPTVFGVEQFKRRDIRAWHIPFGVHTDVYKPPVDKNKLKPLMNSRTIPLDMDNSTTITEDSFVIMINGANKDPYRKAFMRMFTTIQIFLQNNPDAVKDMRFYVHSWMKQARDIPHGAKVLYIQHLGRGTDDLHNLCSVPEDVMAKLYGAADVFMHLSEGGGFEIPILEALACGVPIIGSDFVGMGDLINNHGWAIPMKTRYFSQLDALQGIADEYKAADALEDAYNHPEKRESFGKAGREFALQFDFSKVNRQWIDFFEDIRSETGYKPLETRVL